MTRYRHGDTGTRLHNIWRGIVKRCDATSGEAFEKYAGRGISLCAEWRVYEAFRDWANANGYRDDLTIDRRDNEGSYSPDNCRWAGLKQQARNRRNTHLVSAFGRSQSLADWQDETGIGWSTILYRINAGWAPETALTKRPLVKPGRPRLAA